MSYVSEITRQRVRKRAGNRCEYCLSHQDYIMGRLQIDHVYPVAKGGENTEENLCLACELCNQYKWTKTEELDPMTNENVTLFNPRQQTWSEHFSWSDDGTEIMGITPCGRATIIALRLNNALAVAVRKNWVKVGWHPPTK
jgi:hypothetical protein